MRGSRPDFPTISSAARFPLQWAKAAPSFTSRRIIGVRVARIELDEVWTFVGKKQNGGGVPCN